jgi:large subunit ribosomal protein L34e
MVHVKHKVRGAPKIEMKGAPRYRSKVSLVRVQRRTPGGRTVTHYKKPKPNIAKCAICKMPLHGLPRLIPAKAKKAKRTVLTIQRPFGANLCSSCMRDILRWRVRLKYKLCNIDEIPISIKEFVKAKA